MTTDNTPNTTTIRVSNEFKARLGTHGQFGERFEDILIRLLGDKFLNTATGDKDTKVYSVDDVDSKKIKRLLKKLPIKEMVKVADKARSRPSQKTGKLEERK